MLKQALSLLLLTVALSMPHTACKKGPCEGGGKFLEKKPLPPEWKALDSIPSGTHQCGSKEQKTEPHMRRFDMPGKSPKEAYEVWMKHLRAKGFRLVKPEISSLGYSAIVRYTGSRAASRGAQIKVYVSRSVKDRGWVTVTFTPPGAKK